LEGISIGATLKGRAASMLLRFPKISIYSSIVRRRTVIIRKRSGDFFAAGAARIALLSVD
jgi:hypothetical protein